FQLAAHFSRRSWLFRIAAYEDLRHLLKHKRRYAPEALTAAERRVLAKKSLLTRVWMATGKKLYYRITRDVLHVSDREGGGARLRAAGRPSGRTGGGAGGGSGRSQPAASGPASMRSSKAIRGSPSAACANSLRPRPPQRRPPNRPSICRCPGNCREPFRARCAARSSSSLP